MDRRLKNADHGPPTACGATAAECHGAGERSRTLIGLVHALALLLSLPLLTHAQPGVTTFGIQLKPVIPFGFFDPLTEVGNPPLTGSLELTGGFSFGMLVRTGLTRTLSLEVGIDQINRRYDWRVVNDTAGFDDGEQLRYVGYEIPVLLLAYIRLGERFWMNNALGLSADLYPSDAVRDIEDARAFIFRNNWAQGGAMGNIGFEYRTPRSGILYLGATYHRPFGSMALAQLTWYTPDLYPHTLSTELDGSYLTVDVRYFFHEKADRNKSGRE